MASIRANSVMQESAYVQLDDCSLPCPRTHSLVLRNSLSISAAVRLSHVGLRAPPWPCPSCFKADSVEVMSGYQSASSPTCKAASQALVLLASRSAAHVRASCCDTRPAFVMQEPIAVGP
eukprot:6195301-Pleurochrysis_carterae.AAC.4